MTWKTPNIIEIVSGKSKHHLFEFWEVREKIIRLFGQPESDKDYIIFDKRIKECMDKMPVFCLSEENHNEYHIKYPRKLKKHLQSD